MTIMKLILSPKSQRPIMLLVSTYNNQYFHINVDILPAAFH